MRTGSRRGRGWVPASRRGCAGVVPSAIGFFSELSRSPNARADPRISIWRDYEIEMSVAALNVRFLLKTPEAALAEVQNRVQWRFDRLLRRWDVVGEERRAEWREYARW